MIFQKKELISISEKLLKNKIIQILESYKIPYWISNQKNGAFCISVRKKDYEKALLAILQ